MICVQNMKSVDAGCCEEDRIDFLIERDGLEAAKKWARNGYKNYRQAVLDKTHFANNKEYRRKYISGYLCLKRFSMS